MPKGEKDFPRGKRDKMIAPTMFSEGKGDYVALESNFFEEKGTKLYGGAISLWINY
jgi:hypothetical protein